MKFFTGRPSPTRKCSLSRWVMPDRILRARAGAPQIIHERPSCEVYETKDITGQERH